MTTAFLAWGATWGATYQLAALVTIATTDPVDKTYYCVTGTPLCVPGVSLTTKAACHKGIKLAFHAASLLGAWFFLNILFYTVFLYINHFLLPNTPHKTLFPLHLTNFIKKERGHF